MENYEIEYESQSDENFYIDGDDKKPKLVLIIGGILLLIVIILIFFFACSGGKNDSNNYLSNISIPNGTITPEFSKDVPSYSLAVTEEFVTVSCTAESNKAITEGCGKRIYLSDECTEHIIKVTSQSKQSREYKLNICKQPKEAPIINKVEVSPSEYTKDKVTLRVEVTSKNELNDKAYSFDGGKTWQQSNTIEVSENKIIEIKVRDKNNNESAVYSQEIKTIDKTMPSVTIEGSVSSGTLTTSNVKLTAVVNPATTPSSYNYQWYRGKDTIKGATKSTYTATSSGQYKVKITTGSGNSVTSQVFVVNKKANTSASYKINIDVTKNTEKWTKDNVVLAIKATATNGLATNAYSFDDGKNFQKESSKSFSTNQTVKIAVKDKKGNIEKYTLSIKNIDKTNPAVSISGGNTVGSKLTARVNPAKTDSGYKYQWYLNTKLISGATSSTYTTSQVGDYQVKVTTGSGISKTSEKLTVRTEVKPNVSLTGSNGTSGNWTKDNVLLTAKVTNGTAKQYKWYSGKDLVGTTYSNVYSVIKEGNLTYKVEVEFTDGTKVTSGSVNIKIDKTAPSVPTLKYTQNSYDGSSYTEETWTKNTVYRQIKSSDILSGIDHFEYKNSSSSATTCSGSKDGDEILNNATNGISNNTNYQIKRALSSPNYACFRTVDKAGNASAWTRVQKILVDKEGPKITIDARLGSYNGTKYTSGNWTNKDIYITVTATDEAGMGNSMLFQYEGENSKWYGHPTLAWETLTISGKTAIGKINLTEDRNYPFTVKATDSLGNYSVETILTKLDKTAPYTPAPTKQQNILTCYNHQGKIIEPNPKTTTISYCEGETSTNYNFALSEKDNDGGSGIDYCEGVYDLVGESSNSRCKPFGNAGSFDVLPYRNIDTIKWVNLNTVEVCATTATKVAYIKRCVDKAGNKSNLIMVKAKKK